VLRMPKARLSSTLRRDTRTAGATATAAQGELRRLSRRQESTAAAPSCKQKHRGEIAPCQGLLRRRISSAIGFQGRDTVPLTERAPTVQPEAPQLE